jgi:AcrR family transcriptional regulator
LTDPSVSNAWQDMEGAASLAVSGSRRRRKAARPAELLEAAIEIFAEKGFAATRLEEVARRAGVSKGTAYLYFPTKEALFKAAIREVVVTRLVMGEREVEEWQGSSAALLRRMLEQWGQLIRSRQGGLIKLIVAEARNFPDLAAWYQAEIGERGHRLLMAVLERGIAAGEFRRGDVEAMAQVVACPLAFRAIWSNSVGCYEKLPLSDERFYDSYLTLMLAGLRPEKKE